MTQAQALKKAVQLFGKTGAVQKSKCFHWERRPIKGVPQHGPTYCRNHGPASGCPGGRPWYEVGSIRLIFFMVEGGGDSWEKAFEAYEAKRAKEKAEYAALVAKTTPKKRARL